MRYSPPRKKIRMSDNIDTKLTDLDQSSSKSKSPAIAKDRYLSFFRGLRDLCLEPPSPDDDDDDDEEIICGSAITYFNADKQDFARDYAKLALEFYNCTKLTNFKLVKVCKANFGGLHYGLTFRAQEDEGEECPLFRGAVKCVIGSGIKSVFCEIKGNDEVTLLPGDDDYISLDSSCDRKDSSLLTCKKKDTGDCCPANCGDVSTGGFDVSEGSLK